MYYLIWDNRYPQDVLMEFESVVSIYHVFEKKGTTISEGQCQTLYHVHNPTGLISLTGTCSYCRACRSHRALVKHCACPCPAHFLYQLLGATEIRPHKLGALQPWKPILTQFWRLEVLNKGGSRPMLSLKAVGKDPSLPLHSFWWLLAVLDISWLAAASLQSSPPSSHGLSAFV